MLHDQSLQAAAQAKQAVERNAMMLQQKLAERSKLLSQLEQAKMQEQVSASLNQMSELAVPGNTPNLDQVRDKIERRYANALGSAELAKNSVQGGWPRSSRPVSRWPGTPAGADPRQHAGEALPSAGAPAAAPDLAKPGTLPGQTLPPQTH